MQAPFVPTGSSLALLIALALPAAAQPTIDSLEPGNGGTSGGILLTIRGQSFEPAPATATVDGNACPEAEPPSATQIVCTLPAGSGADVPVQVTAGGLPSNTVVFSYDPPSISQLTPSSAPTAGGTVLTIIGSNFGPPGAPLSVAIGSSACPVLASQHTEVSCEVPEGQGANLDAIVTVDGQTSDPGSFSYAAPVISSLVPSSGPRSGDTTLRVAGHNLGTTASVLLFDGTTTQVLSQSHEEIQGLTPAVGADVHDTTVRVVLDAGTPQEQTSNTSIFSYLSAVPTAGAGALVALMAGMVISGWLAGRAREAPRSDDGSPPR